MLAKRFSTYYFDKNKDVDQSLIESILDAARHAPSHYNTQPWRFIVGREKNESYKKLLNALVDANQVWAQNAPVLICLLHHNYSKEGELWSIYDTGQAAFSMVNKAHELHLNVHQMSGFDPNSIIENFDLAGKEIYPIAVAAVGYSTKQYGDETPRDRKTLNELILA
jgi:nitroreductase